ncbi:hypothetical protein DEU56DRAFT_428907 [Suillus clintonianus]|uniref:uncharacterized protein n=1 Tax=Suillus clintonianus TaxID=1904413 RepID=UPI001B861C49|nr:uncharacterized protein DEU56DRAFT_428907 [Suillus clintonianus]KAG2153916.1 hypothetical protein DEU56DRAFT_428907 [Suillus clintonianus]
MSLLVGVQETDQNAYWVAEQITASVPPRHRVPSQTMSAPTSRSSSPTFRSSSPTLVPSPSRALTSLTRHFLSTASTLSLTGPLNVLLFGETGVGKSSIINLIMGGDTAQTSPDGGTCTLTHTSYEVDLGTHNFKLWEVSSIGSMGFFRSFFKKWRLKKALKKLHRDEGVYLLLYCMRGSRAHRALLSDYKHFTDIVGSTAGPGRVPVAAVVTSLEDYPTNMDNWWTKNKDNLERLGMQFSSHACITSLPYDPNWTSAMRARRHQSEQAIRKLIHDSYRAGRTPVSSNLAFSS